MSATRCCEQCGALLPPRAPGGLCPKCLLGQAMSVPADVWTADEAPSLGAGSPSADFSIRRFGDYELLEQVAEGGMGVVYRARQLSLNRIVAVKMIQPGRVGSPEMVLRFRAEAEAAASLHHPNIVPIHETGECEGQHYFSMAYIEGKNLAEAVREGPLPSARAAQLVEKIAAAVQYAHQHKILHRDLKPSNVILDEAGEPHVTDFGLARRLGGDSTLTLTGQVFGSPQFMPPEQASGRRGAVGAHSDVYGLGAIFYHLLTARPPFVGETMETTLAQVIESEPVSPRLLNASVPRDLETTCLKCLEKEPSRRYASAQAVADELGRFLRSEPILARPVSRPEKVWRWCRRKPALATALAVVVLVAAVGFVGVLSQWQRAKAGELLARQNAQAELRQRERAEASEYAADMHLAQLALADNNRGLAVSLLNKYRPGFGVPASAGAAHPTAAEQPDRRKAGLRTDLRGWEWRYLWQLCRGDELFTLHGYPRPIRAVAVSKDGTVLALACGDQVALWDLTTKQPLTALPIATTEALTFSPTGDLLAVGTWNPAGRPGIDLWDVNHGKVTRTLTHEAEVRSAAFSPDGKLLATFDNRGNIKVADWASDRTLTNFTVSPPRRRPAGVVVFSPDGNRLAIGGDYGHVRLLDLRTGTVLPFQTKSSEGVHALVFSSDARLLAAGLGSSVRIWDSNSGESRGQLTNHTGAVRAIAFTPDGRQLASASLDGTIRIWSAADQTEVRCFQSSGEGLTGLAMLPDGHTLVTGGDTGTVCFWDATASTRAPAHTNWGVGFWYHSLAELETLQFGLKTFDPKAAYQLGFKFTPDSRSFIASDPAGSLAVWDVRSVRITEKLPALGSNHWSVALSPDGRWLAAGENSGILTIWDWTARRAVTNFTVPCEFYGKLGFSRSGNFLFAVSLNNEWVTSSRIWHTGDWKEVALTGNQSAGLLAVDLSADDRLLAAGYQNGAVRLFHFPSGGHEATFTNHQAIVMEVRFSPDGRELVSTSFDGSARLWDVFARRELATMRGHFGMVCSAALSPDGRRLATGGTSPRDAVKLWDLVAHRELLNLQGEGQYFMHVAFSPDGNTLAAVTFDGIAHLWRAPTWVEIETAEKEGATP